MIMYTSKVTTLAFTFLLPLLLSRLGNAAPAPQRSQQPPSSAATRLANAEAAQQQNSAFRNLTITDPCTGASIPLLFFPDGGAKT